jgi:hypothetical protein
MKKLSFLFLISISSSFSQEEFLAQKKATFDLFEKKIGLLKEAKTCISKANTLVAYKACKFDLQEEMEILEEDMIEQARARKEE